MSTPSPRATSPGSSGSPARDLSEAAVVRWCRRLIDPDPAFPPLEECLAAIPALDDLSDLPPGTRVLMRADTNVPLGTDGRIADDARLVSLLESLNFGIERGWVWIVCGHAGTDSNPSLRPVADRLEQLLHSQGRSGAQVRFIGPWMNDATGAVLDEAADAIRRLKNGTVGVLENARQASLERGLWQPENLAALAPRMTRHLQDVRAKLATIQVNEGFAASNRDVSSTLVPMGMDRVALGRHARRELAGLGAVRRAELIVFSGAKVRKLDDLEGVLRRGSVRRILLGGALGLAFLKADAIERRQPFEMGLASDPDRAYGESHLPPERIAQAGRLLRLGRECGALFVLPVDFRLADGRVSEVIPPGGTQLDLGPRTIALQEACVTEFLEFHRLKLKSGAGPAIVFHNGVLGVFEREEFAEATRHWMGQLRRLHDSGVLVYVGGGEGGAALDRLGDASRVTHCFTAGGTILKALGSEPIPYVKALWMAAFEK